MPISLRERAISGLFLVSFFYACFGPVARELSRDLATFQQTYVRLIIALIFTKLLFPSRVTVSSLTTLPRREWLILAGRSLMGYPIGVGIFILASGLTKLAHVSFICALPLTAVWAIILFRERPQPLQVAGLVLSTLGLALVSLQDVFDIFSWQRGELYAFISAIGFSFALVSRRFHPSETDNSVLSTGFNFTGFLWLLLCSLLLNEPVTFTPSVSLLILLLAAGLMVTILSAVQSYVFVHVSGSLAGSILSLESVFALAIAWALYGELPTQRHLAGGCLILIGALLTVWSQRASSGAIAVANIAQDLAAEASATSRPSESRTECRS